MMIYLLCLVLFCVGIYGLLSKRNIIKMIVGLIIAEHAVNLFFILVAYRRNGRAPILAPDVVITQMVDPLPQASGVDGHCDWFGHNRFVGSPGDTYLRKVRDL